jgi:hypothetical protein
MYDENLFRELSALSRDSDLEVEVLYATTSYRADESAAAS